MDFGMNVRLSLNANDASLIEYPRSKVYVTFGGESGEHIYWRGPAEVDHVAVSYSGWVMVSGVSLTGVETTLTNAKWSEFKSVMPNNCIKTHLISLRS